MVCIAYFEAYQLVFLFPYMGFPMAEKDVKWLRRVLLSIPLYGIPSYSITNSCSNAVLVSFYSLIWDFMELDMSERVCLSSSIFLFPYMGFR